MTLSPQGSRPHGRRLVFTGRERSFVLESGQTLEEIQIEYETWGTLNRDGTNAILVCHALTGNAHAARHSPDDDAGWWDGVIGPGKCFDTDRYYVVCSNILGSCYGSTGPWSADPRTGQVYGTDFPAVSVRDMVRTQHTLLVSLGVRRLAAVAGGSLGGMQVLEWAILYPAMVERIIPIATASRHSAWCIALNEVGRLSIMTDPDWREGHPVATPERGLALARMIAMISYRSRQSFEQRFGRRAAGHPPAHPWNTNSPAREDVFDVESYLHYQGQKLVQRFDPRSYVTLSRAMDGHDLSRGRGSVVEALGGIRARTLCIGIRSDILYPPEEQREIHAAIPGATYTELNSPHGHDAFLIEFDQLTAAVERFLHDAGNGPDSPPEEQRRWDTRKERQGPYCE